MAKHLSSGGKPEKTKVTETLPRLLKWKKPGKRTFDYARRFSLEEIVPVAAAALLFLIARFVPFGRAVRFVLYLVTALAAGFSVLRRCMEKLLYLKLPDEDGLLPLASLCAFLSGHFATGAALMLLGRCAEFAQAYVLERGHRSLQALREVLPEKAHVEEEFGVIDLVPEELKEGDVFIVEKGEAFPTDGEVIEGESTVDSSAFGGSETPEAVGVGSMVLAGFVNGDSTLRLRALHSFEDSALPRHLRNLTEAEEEKTYGEGQLEGICSWLAPVLAALAVLVGLILPVFDGNWKPGLYKASLLLFIATPASLLLSLRTVFLGGLVSASRSGVRVRSKNALEALALAKTIVFGKTGTLTEAHYTVSEVVPKERDAEELLRIAAAAEGNSRHPIAQAIREAAGLTPISAEEVLEMEEIPGRGVSAFVEGKTVFVGNAALLEEHGLVFQIPSRTGTAIHVAVDGVYWGYILLADKIREGAFDALEELRSEGLNNIVLLTGDVRSSASTLARSLGFDMVRAELTPDEKLSSLQYLGKSLGINDTLAYVGDGFHDEKLFRHADVGISLNARGDDRSEKAADVILMDDDILRVPAALKIASACRRIFRENGLFFAAMTAVLLVLGLSGILVPFAAAVLHTAGSCLIMANALRSFFAGK